MHDISCQFLGEKGSFSCSCPHRLAAGTKIIHAPHLYREKSVARRTCRCCSFLQEATPCHESKKFQNSNSSLSSLYMCKFLLFLLKLLIALLTSLENSLAAGTAKTVEMHFPAKRCSFFKSTVFSQRIESLNEQNDAFLSAGNLKARTLESQIIPRNFILCDGTKSHLSKF